MFNFLGVNSKGCRRRFVCEMEFRSNRDPLTAMAFRIVGRGLLGPYLNENKQTSKAVSFQECAKVNPDCTVIEEDEIDDQPEDQENENINEVESVDGSKRNGQNHLAEIIFSRSK